MARNYSLTERVKMHEPPGFPEGQPSRLPSMCKSDPSADDSIVAWRPVGLRQLHTQQQGMSKPNA